MSPNDRTQPNQPPDAARPAPRGRARPGACRPRRRKPRPRGRVSAGSAVPERRRRHRATAAPCGRANRSPAGSPRRRRPSRRRHGAARPTALRLSAIGGRAGRRSPSRPRPRIHLPPGPLPIFPLRKEAIGPARRRRRRGAGGGRRRGRPPAPTGGRPPAPSPCLDRSAPWPRRCSSVRPRGRPARTRRGPPNRTPSRAGRRRRSTVSGSGRPAGAGVGPGRRC